MPDSVYDFEAAQRRRQPTALQRMLMSATGTPIDEEPVEHGEPQSYNFPPEEVPHRDADLRNRPAPANPRVALKMANQLQSLAGGAPATAGGAPTPQLFTPQQFDEQRPAPPVTPGYFGPNPIEQPLESTLPNADFLEAINSNRADRATLKGLGGGPRMVENYPTDPISRESDNVAREAELRQMMQGAKSGTAAIAADNTERAAATDLYKQHTAGMQGGPRGADVPSGNLGELVAKLSGRYNPAISPRGGFAREGVSAAGVPMITGNGLRIPTGPVVSPQERESMAWNKRTADFNNGQGGNGTSDASLVGSTMIGDTRWTRDMQAEDPAGFDAAKLGKNTEMGSASYKAEREYKDAERRIALAEGAERGKVQRDAEKARRQESRDENNKRISDRRRAHGQLTTGEQADQVAIRKAAIEKQTAEASQEAMIDRFGHAGAAGIISGKPVDPALIPGYEQRDRERAAKKKTAAAAAPKKNKDQAIIDNYRDNAADDGLLHPNREQNKKLRKILGMNGGGFYNGDITADLMRQLAGQPNIA